MAVNPILHCPIRGALKIKAKAKDGLTFTEEKLRIDCIRHLLALGYPKERIKTETVVLRVGHKGKNALRADIVIFDCAADSIASLPIEQARDHIQLIGEIKRDEKGAESGKNDQLRPALAFIPSHGVLGIYWDDVEQSLLFKEVSGNKTVIVETSIAQLPPFGAKLKIKSLHYEDLVRGPDLVKVFSRFDDALHQAGHDL